MNPFKSALEKEDKKEQSVNPFAKALNIKPKKKRNVRPIKAKKAKTIRDNARTKQTIIEKQPDTYFETGVKDIFPRAVNSATQDRGYLRGGVSALSDIATLPQRALMGGAEFGGALWGDKKKAFNQKMQDITPDDMIESTLNDPLLLPLTLLGGTEIIKPIIKGVSKSKRLKDIVSKIPLSKLNNIKIPQSVKTASNKIISKTPDWINTTVKGAVKTTPEAIDLGIKSGAIRGLERFGAGSDWDEIKSASVRDAKIGAMFPYVTKTFGHWFKGLGKSATRGSYSAEDAKRSWVNKKAGKPDIADDLAAEYTPFNEDVKLALKRYPNSKNPDAGNALGIFGDLKDNTPGVASLHPTYQYKTGKYIKGITPKTMYKDVNSKISNLDSELLRYMSDNPQKVDIHKIINEVRDDINISKRTFGTTGFKGKTTAPVAKQFSGAEDKALKILDNLDKEINAKMKKDYISDIEALEFKRDLYKRADALFNKEAKNVLITPDQQLKQKIDKEVALKINKLITGGKNIPKALNEEMGKLLELKRFLEDKASKGKSWNLSVPSLLRDMVTGNTTSRPLTRTGQILQGKTAPALLTGLSTSASADALNTVPMKALNTLLRRNPNEDR